MLLGSSRPYPWLILEESGRQADDDDDDRFFLESTIVHISKLVASHRTIAIYLTDNLNIKKTHNHAPHFLDPTGASFTIY